MPVLGGWGFLFIPSPLLPLPLPPFLRLSLSLLFMFPSHSFPFFFVLFLLITCLSHTQLSIPWHSKQSLITCVKRKQETTCLLPWGQICSFSNLRGNHPFITRDTLLGLWSKIPTSVISLMARGPSRSCTPWTPLSPKELSLGISHILPWDGKGRQDPVYELGLFQPFSPGRISTF